MPLRLAHRPIWWAYFLNWGSLFPERLWLVSVDIKLVSTAYNLGPSQADSYGSECHSAFTESKWQEIRTIWPPHAELPRSVSGSFLPAHNSETHCEAQRAASVFCLWVCNQITIATAMGLGKLLFQGRSYGCEHCTFILARFELGLL